MIRTLHTLITPLLYQGMYMVHAIPTHPSVRLSVLSLLFLPPIHSSSHLSIHLLYDVFTYINKSKVPISFLLQALVL